MYRALNNDFGLTVYIEDVIIGVHVPMNSAGSPYEAFCRPVPYLAITGSFRTFPAPTTLEVLSWFLRIEAMSRATDLHVRIHVEKLNPSPFVVVLVMVFLF